MGGAGFRPCQEATPTISPRLDQQLLPPLHRAQLGRRLEAQLRGDEAHVPRRPQAEALGVAGGNEGTQARNRGETRGETQPKMEKPWKPEKQKVRPATFGPRKRGGVPKHRKRSNKRVLVVKQMCIYIYIYKSYVHTFKPLVRGTGILLGRVWLSDGKPSIMGHSHLANATAQIPPGHGRGFLPIESLAIVARNA